MCPQASAVETLTVMNCRALLMPPACGSPKWFFLYVNLTMTSQHSCGPQGLARFLKEDPPVLIPPLSAPSDRYTVPAARSTPSYLCTTPLPPLEHLIFIALAFPLSSVILPLVSMPLSALHILSGNSASIALSAPHPHSNPILRPQPCAHLPAGLEEEHRAGVEQCG